jgi:hypothetical protein
LVNVKVYFTQSRKEKLTCLPVTIERRNILSLLNRPDSYRVVEVQERDATGDAMKN